MHFDLDERGDWIVDLGELARKFGTSTGYLQHQIRLGLLKSFLETESDECEGRSRITVRAGKMAWQGTFDSAGFLIGEEMLPEALATH
ncbi:DUF6522 family protein [Methylobacterium nigriterrae]|uniref:DUF6522 family protein n=1 Tax=Methylobacterium nigriterrae TaxID=3127512 RepID=UPI003013DAC0